MNHPHRRAEEGETIRECGVRECKEETGIDIEVTGLVGVFTTPEHVIEYRSAKGSYDIHPALRRRIDHGLSGAGPHVD